jgi:hypothetical protein
MDRDNSTKVIICLAASWRPGGRCIAGKEISDKKWVRPVSGGKDDGINDRQSLYPDGNSAQVLDIIEIPVLKSIPKQYQKENILIDPSEKWQKKGVFDRQELVSLLDNPPSLWHNLDSSTNGKNDRIPVSETKGIDNSLYLIQAKCEINVKTEGKEFKEFNDPKKGCDALSYIRILNISYR